MIDKLKSSDFGAGLLFAAIGGLGLILSVKLTVGTASRMGPGYMPRIFAGIVAGLGLILIVRALHSGTPDLDQPKLRPFVAILASIAVFGLAIERLGLVVAVVALVLVASLGSADLTKRGAFTAAIALALTAYLLFVRLLDLPIPVWPKF
jgi:hypothetical protein